LLLSASAGVTFLPDSSAYVQDLSLRFTGLSLAHPLGTDALGRDLLLRLLRGGQVSLIVGAVAAILALFIGTTVGMISGYVGGRVDRLLMGCVDVFYALPVTLLMLLFLVFVGSGTGVLCLAIGLTEWFALARVIRARTLDLRCRTFVLAASAIGQSHRRILLDHILPHLIPMLSDYALLLLSNAVLMEAFLSFLGLGVRPPGSSWGNMIVDGTQTLGEHPLQLLLPATCLVLTLLSLQTLRKREEKP
jgi:oligopeptide transport system permease protein